MAGFFSRKTKSQSALPAVMSPAAALNDQSRAKSATVTRDRLII